jgi:hypothetical protein
MAHPADKHAQCHAAPVLAHVRLVQHAVLAAAVAGDAQEPRLEARGWLLEALKMTRIVRYKRPEVASKNRTGV